METEIIWKYLHYCLLLEDSKGSSAAVHRTLVSVDIYDLGLLTYGSVKKRSYGGASLREHLQGATLKYGTLYDTYVCRSELLQPRTVRNKDTAPGSWSTVGGLGP